jgi:hypothetical protein
MAKKLMKRAAQRTRYFTNITTKGKVRYGKFPFAISVLEAPDNYIPIGIADSVTSTDAGLAEWRVSVEDTDVPGLFVIVTVNSSSSAIPQNDGLDG